MSDDVRWSVPDTLDRDVISKRLDRVLDPELDESILKLGFVRSLEAQDGHLTVELHLPTYWCAPNFAFLMAYDVRVELLAVEGVQDVTVRVTDHFASEAIGAAVSSGKSFTEAFPDEASGNLDQLRDLFLRKGYIKRQERLLRRLRGAGLSLEEIAGLRVEDVYFEDEACWARRGGGQVSRLAPAEVASQYLERRAEIGLDCSPATPLMTNLLDDAIPAGELEEYLIRARTVRVSLEAGGALCSALLEARKTEKSKAS